MAKLGNRKVSGFKSNKFVRGRLQAALYYNRKDRIARINGGLPDNALLTADGDSLITADGDTITMET